MRLPQTWSVLMIQTSILPSALTMPGLEIAARMRTASENQSSTVV